jgi:SAM-dependent MidA family methyltransferase
MINESNFIVRQSGRNAGSYYIDYSGVYKVPEIAKIAGLKPTSLKEIYAGNGAVLDDIQKVYYFSSLDSAKKTIADIFNKIKVEQKGRIVMLSEAEIEYIRRALINEGANTLHVSNKVKDAIFKKLNE